MILPPAVIIHGLRDARLALAPGRQVTLLSAPAAALYGGCLWWYKLIEAAATDQPNLLDCLDAPGRAVEALRMGLKGIVLDCEPALFTAVDALAAQHGAVLLRKAPEALDLQERGAERRLAGWLAP